MHNVDVVCYASETIKMTNFGEIYYNIYIYFKVMITHDFTLYCSSVTALFTRTSNCTVKPAHPTKNKYNTKYKPNYNTQFEFVEVYNILRYSNLLLHRPWNVFINNRLLPAINEHQDKDM
jgi:hypothetical protein